MELQNYTPHRTMAFYPPEGEPVPLPSLGLARADRCVTSEVAFDAFGGVPCNSVAFGAVQGLPAPRDGVTLVVSMLVVQLLPDRLDLVFPDDLVRDDEGTIIGFRSVARLANRR